MINKRVASLADALSGVRDGATVLVAGFGDVGIANSLIEALQDRGVRDLTVVPTTPATATGASVG